MQEVEPNREHDKLRVCFFDQKKDAYSPHYTEIMN